MRDRIKIHENYQKINALCRNSRHAVRNNTGLDAKDSSGSE